MLAMSSDYDMNKNLIKHMFPLSLVLDEPVLIDREHGLEYRLPEVKASRFDFSELTTVREIAERMYKDACDDEWESIDGGHSHSGMDLWMALSSLEILFTSTCKKPPVHTTITCKVPPLHTCSRPDTWDEIPF